MPTDIDFAADVACLRSSHALDKHRLWMCILRQGPEGECEKRGVTFHSRHKSFAKSWSLLDLDGLEFKDADPLVPNPGKV